MPKKPAKATKITSVAGEPEASDFEKPEKETTEAASDPSASEPLDDTQDQDTLRPRFQVVEEPEPEPESAGKAYQEEEQLEPESPTSHESSAAPEARSEEAATYATNEPMTMSDPGSNPPSTQHDFHFNREPKRKFPWWILVIILIIGLIGAGAWRFFFSTSQESANQPSVTDILVEPPAQELPSPSPQPEEVKREDLRVQVLNGSGIVGAAGKLAAVLEAAGFKDIDTDNADSYDYEGVVIQVKDGRDDIADLIESDLANDYEDIEIEDTLEEDSDYDAAVILGSQPGDEDVLGEQDEIDQPTDKENDEATNSATNE